MRVRFVRVSWQPHDGRSDASITNNASKVFSEDLSLDGLKIPPAFSSTFSAIGTSASSMPCQVTAAMGTATALFGVLFELRRAGLVRGSISKRHEHGLVGEIRAQAVERRESPRHLSTKSGRPRHLIHVDKVNQEAPCASMWSRNWCPKGCALLRAFDQARDVRYDEKRILVLL